MLYLIIYSVVHVKVTHMVTLTPSWREHSLMVCAILIQNSVCLCLSRLYWPSLGLWPVIRHCWVYRTNFIYYGTTT